MPPFANLPAAQVAVQDAAVAEAPTPSVVVDLPSGQLLQSDAPSVRALYLPMAQGLQKAFILSE